MEDNPTEKILSFLSHFRDRRSLFVIGKEATENYKLCSQYLDGYFGGLETAYGANLNLHIGLSVGDKLGRGRNMVWSYNIADYYKDKNDLELIEITISLLEEFFQQNPDWRDFIWNKL